MKTICTVWVFLAAVVGCIQGIWFVVNRSPLLPAITMLLGTAALFALGFRLTMSGNRQW